jgi:hypothetical protein
MCEPKKLNMPNCKYCCYNIAINFVNIYFCHNQDYTLTFFGKRSSEKNTILG